MTARVSSPRLRTIVTAASVALGLMSLVLCTTLMLLTTHLHRTGMALRDAVASVKVAEEAQIDLLMHERATDRVVRVELAEDLRSRLATARRYVTSDEELRAVQRAEQEIATYFETRADPDAAASARAHTLESAYRALERVITVNVDQANLAIADSMRSDALGDVVGVSAGVLMLAVLVILLWWVHRAVVRPLLSLSAAMERFAGGDLDARTGEHGAAELRQMARRFNQLAAALAHQHEARQTYLAGIVHDLRNPLGALQMSAVALATNHGVSSDERLTRLVGVVHRQVDRLNRMLGDLLDAAQIESGHLKLELEVRDLRPLVREAAELFEHTSRSHPLRLELPASPIHVRCDPGRIQQTLVNLLSNAIKYSPDGGEIRITAEVDGGRAALHVVDHGVGISAEDLERLWQPFRRSRATGSQIPGAGLGLSIVRRIVSAHGGEITVQSQPGAGSTFSVFLPLSEPNAPAQAKEGDALQQSASPALSR